MLIKKILMNPEEDGSTDGAPDDGAVAPELRSYTLGDTEIKVDAGSSELLTKHLRALDAERQSATEKMNRMQEELSKLQKPNTTSQTHDEDVDTIIKNRESKLNEQWSEKYSTVEKRINQLQNKMIDVALDSTIRSVESVDQSPENIEDIKKIVRDKFRYNNDKDTIEVLGDDAYPMTVDGKQVSPSQFIEKWLSARPRYMKREVMKALEGESKGEGKENITISDLAKNMIK